MRTIPGCRRVTIISTAARLNRFSGTQWPQAGKRPGGGHWEATARLGTGACYELGTAGGLVLAPGGAPKKRWKPCWSWVTSMIRMTVVVPPLTVAVTTTWLPALMEPMPSRWAFTLVELVTG